MLIRHHGKHGLSIPARCCAAYTLPIPRATPRAIQCQGRSFTLVLHRYGYQRHAQAVRRGL